LQRVAGAFGARRAGAGVARGVDAPADRIAAHADLAGHAIRVARAAVGAPAGSAPVVPRIADAEQSRVAIAVRLALPGEGRRGVEGTRTDGQRLGRAFEIRAPADGAALTGVVAGVLAAHEDGDRVHAREVGCAAAAASVAATAATTAGARAGSGVEPEGGGQARVQGGDGAECFHAHQCEPFARRRELRTEAAPCGGPATFAMTPARRLARVSTWIYSWPTRRTANTEAPCRSP